MKKTLFCSVGSFEITKTEEGSIQFHDYIKGSENFKKGLTPNNDWCYAICEKHLIAYITILNMYIDKIISIEEMYKQLDKIYYSKF